MRMSVGVGAKNSWRSVLLLIAGVLSFNLVSPAQAQYACTTNYCIQSQSIAVQTPPGWPSVPIESCCQTHWGALPGNIDWTNGAPVMICTATGEYASAFPNCGGPQDLSQAFPLHYWDPKIGIGVAWPSAKNYSYEMQSVPIIDGPDGTCAQFSQQPGKVANWWVYDLKEPKRGSYVFTASVSFKQGEKGYYAVLNGCRLAPPPATSAQ